ncbi:MAG: hypothetical protein ABIK49_05695, partial [candidate division WOR-3 bacterium]
MVQLDAAQVQPTRAARAVRLKQKEVKMTRYILVLLATLSWLLWAADDAAILPSQGVTAAPLASTLTSPASFSSFAITIPRMLSYQG